MTTRVILDRELSKCAGLVLLAVVSGAQAGPRMYTVGSGDCRAIDFQTHRRAFADELKRRLGAGLMDDDAARSLLAPDATSSVEDLQRRLETARQQYYQGHYDKAEDAIASSLVEIGRLPVGAERWHLNASGELLAALVYRNTKREKQADDAFRRVLRLEPTFVMDEDYYSPTTRTRFEKIRKEVAGTRRVRLNVTSIPSGIEVFVEGRKVGSTPYSGELIPGRYEIALAKGQDRSLPHPVALTREITLPVDFAFESAIHPTRLPCLSTRLDADVTGAAITLGALLGVDEVTVVRFDESDAGPGWLTATLLSTASGGKLREGSLKVARGGRTVDGLPQLTEFVVTGKRTGNVEVNPSVSLGVSLTPTAPTVAASDSSPLEIAESGPPAIRTWKTPAGIALVAGGLIGGGLSGGLLLRESSSQLRQYEKYYQDGQRPSRDEALTPAAHWTHYVRARTQAIVAFSVGGALTVAGGVLLVLESLSFKPTPSTNLAVGIAPSSVSATLQFP
ncbi:MAG: PEGA domain-containing protein [Myxococcaceae bacterium]